MQDIVVYDQPRLSFARTAWITMDGIRYRLFRCAVTVAVIAVAVAFLTNVMSESLIKRSAAAHTVERLAEVRTVHTWIARLTNPGSVQSVLREIAASERDLDAYREAAAFGGLAEPEMLGLHDGARRCVRCLDFFADLAYDHRRDLVGRTPDDELLDRLGSVEGLQRYKDGLSAMPAVRPPFSIEELAATTEAWPGIRDRAAEIVAKRRIAIAEIRRTLSGSSISESLAEADAGFGKVIRAAGFKMSPAVAGRVANQARQLQDARRIEDALDHDGPARVLAREFDVMPVDVTRAMLWQHLRTERRAEEYVGAMEAAGLRTRSLSAGRAVQLAELQAEQEMLTRAERVTVDTGGGMFGMGERMTWLLFVSMLVCGIGISNAMLISVTDRFREIATLKCLGALDGFIMLLFVLESCFLGVAGGLAGGLLGDLIGVSRMMVAFGFAIPGGVPLAELGMGVVVALGFGVGLAAVAAIYPSFVAARLAPMEAMRID